TGPSGRRAESGTQGFLRWPWSGRGNAVAKHEARPGRLPQRATWAAIMQWRARASAATRAPGPGSALQQRHQPAAPVERREVVVATHVRLADEDLRHRAPASALHHVLARGRVGVDADLLDLLHAARLEQLLGTGAVGTHGGRVHLHGLHGDSFPGR